MAERNPRFLDGQFVEHRFTKACGWIEEFDSASDTYRVLHPASGLSGEMFEWHKASALLSKRKETRWAANWKRKREIRNASSLKV